jgi:hypothetical protein
MNIQETVTDEDDVKKANRYYKSSRYTEALAIYTALPDDKLDVSVLLNMR